MVGAYHDPVQQWIITLLLECSFLGFCIIFVGYGFSELKKKKNHLKNTILILTGIFLAILSVIATILLLQGRT
jgi:hypothetical protein